MSRLLTAVIGGGVILAGYLAILFLAQRYLLFPARPLPAGLRHASTEVVRLPLPDGPVDALYLPPIGTGAGSAPILLFTHGNGELADDWQDRFEQPRRWGWAILLVEYPGYGASAGSPSERSIVNTVLAAYDWAAHDPRIDSSRIVPYGRSLGGGPAARLAIERRVPALILESTFTSVRAFAARYLAPGFLVRDPFDNVAALARYRGPLLVMHGKHDDVVPPSQGRALAALVPGAEFHELPCGHNDCPEPWSVVESFLVRNGLGSVPPGLPNPPAR